jgi:hypothetical protein
MGCVTFGSVCSSRPISNACAVCLCSTNLYIQGTETLELHWSSFLAPFKRELWFAIIAAIIVLTMLLVVSHEIRRWCGNTDSHQEHFWESFYCVYGAFCGQGKELFFLLEGGVGLVPKRGCLRSV